MFTELIKELSDPGSDAQRIVNEENQLFNFVSSSLEDFQLTFAEQVLLVEGSQLGVADCVIPPYVEYENLLKDNFSNPFVIRSEIIEWVLNPKVTEVLFKTGSLEVKGVDFIASEDMGLYDRITLLNHSNKFSLNLENQKVSVNLKFRQCKFFSGVSLSNTSVKNLIFDQCWFGKVYSGESLLASDAHINGSLTITVPANNLPDPNTQAWTVLEGHIDLSHSTISGFLEIEGYRNTRDFQTSIIVKGVLNLNGLQVKQIALQDISIKNELELTNARFQGLSIHGSRLKSVSGGGIVCNTLFIRGGTLIEQGAFFHKSIVHLDLECSGSFIGASGDTGGIALCISSSNIQNLILGEGSVLFSGILDLRNCTIKNKLSLGDTMILGAHIDQRHMAIRAINLRVNNMIDFKRDLPSPRMSYLQFHNKIKKKIEEFKASYVPEYIDFIKLHTKTKSYLHKQQSYNRSISFVFKEIRENHFDKHEVILSVLESGRPITNLFFGEINFRHSSINGSFDLRETYIITDRGDKALDLQFAKIENSLFINEIIAPEGEIDLGNSYIGNLFIKLPDKMGEDSPLKLIGSKYDYIECNTTTANDTKRFYQAKWIKKQSHRDNFRQPYEQFAKALMQAGEDGKARDVLVFHRPWSSRAEWAARITVKGFYLLGKRLQIALISISILLAIGSVYFEWMYNQGYLKIKDRPHYLPIDGFQLSLDRILPIVNIGPDWNFYFEVATPWFHKLYYDVHSMVGLILISLLIVNIARTRKGSS